MLKTIIPSMFHRRLLLIGTLSMGSLVLIGGQTALLSSGQSRLDNLASLESKLQNKKLVPTIRGQIIDRNGLVLARDAPGYDIAVDYGLLDGRWAYQQAARAARLEAGDRWSWLTEDDQAAAIQEKEAEYLQVVDALWQDLAQTTGNDTEELQARIDRIRSKVQYSKARLWEIWRKREEKRRGQTVTTSDVAQPIAEELQTHAVLFDVDPTALDSIRTRVAEAERSGSDDPSVKVWTQIAVERPKLRLHPNALQTVVLERDRFPGFARSKQPLPVTVDGVAMQLLGTMRGAIAKDVEARPLHATDAQGNDQLDLSGYAERGDQAGAFGVERSYESTLRGQRGQLHYRLDTDDRTEIPTVPGRTVQLTLDIELQAAVQALGDPQTGLTVFRPWYDTKMVSDYRATGEQIPGASVVLDIASGEVLAAVSWPTPSLHAMEADLGKLFADSGQMPMVFRPFSRPLPPGSTVKPLLYVMAVTAGVLTPDDTVNCLGFLDLNHNGVYDTGAGREPRCWIYHNYHTGHGVLNGRQAIEVSCNTYFYDLGRQVGVTTLSDWYSMLGFGKPTGVGVLDEAAGHVPGPRSARELDSKSVMDGVYMGIGQGRIDATPIQVANAYATLARGGTYLEPTIVSDQNRSGPRKTYELGLDPLAVKVALQGMDDVVHGSHGSARALYNGVTEQRETLWNNDGIEIVGKSGTAQNAGQREMIDDDGDGYPEGWGDYIREGNHGWFVTLVKNEGDVDWRYVVVTVMEHAGGGGMSAAPVNNQIHRLLQERGYLHDPARDASAVH